MPAVNVIQPLRSSAAWRVSAFRSARTAGRFALALASGGLMVLAFAPFGLFPLALAGPMTLFWLWQRDRPARAFIHGWCYGIALLAVGAYWLHLSPKALGDIDSPLAEVITALFIITVSVPYGLAGSLFAALRGRLTLFARAALLFPAVWGLAEWMRGWYLSGFSWLVLGYSQTDSPLAGWAPLLGVYGVSLVLAASAALLIVTPRLYRQTQRILALAIVVTLWAGGESLRGVAWTEPAGEPLHVGLIQPLAWKEMNKADRRQRYAAMTRAAWQHSDLVIWPETAVNVAAVALDQGGASALSAAGRSLGSDQWLSKPLLNWDGERPTAWRRADEAALWGVLEAEARAGGKSVLFGASLSDDIRGRHYNSVLALDGSARSIYQKRHLVPFGERLPFDQELRPLWDELNVRGTRFQAGAAPRPLLTVGDRRVGIMICYEAGFGEAVIQALPDAEFLVAVGNDGMFDGTIELTQHLQINQMRALETGRWVARAKRTGISALIAPDGTIAAQAPVSQAYTLHGTVQPRTGMTPYARWGNGATVTLALAMLVLALLPTARSHLASQLAHRIRLTNIIF